MNLDDWLARIESCAPNTIQLGLDRIHHAAQAISLRQPSCPIVTVAGTNGKGSSVALLEASLVQAGYRVGSYTSPHLIRFNERIRIHSQPVDDDVIISEFQRLYDTLSSLELTYFEWVTLVGLSILSQSNCDIWLLEVGLGGRLDAVNLMDPDIALITSIDLDHQDFLGDTREAIAREKAGIMRPGCPVVCSDPNPPAAIVEHAASINAPLTLASRYPDTWPTPRILPCNAAGVLAVLEQLSSTHPVSEAILHDTLTRVAPPGRLQHIAGQCDWVFDVGHNPAAIQQLAQHLAAHPVSGRSLAVFSMLQDKDIDGSVALIQNHFDEWHVAPVASGRSASREKLSQSVKAFSNKPCYTHSSIEQAILAAKARSQPLDRVVVFGSFYTVAAAQGVEIGQQQ